MKIMISVLFLFIFCSGVQATEKYLLIGCDETLPVSKQLIIKNTFLDKGLKSIDFNLYEHEGSGSVWKVTCLSFEQLHKRFTADDIAELKVKVANNSKIKVIPCSVPLKKLRELDMKRKAERKN